MKIKQFLKQYSRLFAVFAFLWGSTLFAQSQDPPYLGIGSSELIITTSCGKSKLFQSISYPQFHLNRDDVEIAIIFPKNMDVNTTDLFSLTSNSNEVPIDDYITEIIRDATNNKVTLKMKSRSSMFFRLNFDFYIKNIGLGNASVTTQIIQGGTVVDEYTTVIFPDIKIEPEDSCFTATDDVFGVVTPGTATTMSIFANDLSIYGSSTDPVTGEPIYYRPNGTYGPNDASTQNPNNTTATLTNDGGLTGVVLNADGTLTIPQNATPGDYTLTYEICSPEASTLSCRTATITLTIPSVNAVDDPNFATFNHGAGGTTPNSVLDNDKYEDGSQATPANVTISTVGNWPTGITLNPDGTITVADDIPYGEYPLEYQICSKTNNTACDTATVTIVVNHLVANPDSGQATEGEESFPISNVVNNDTLNGQPVTIGTADGQVTVSEEGTWPAGLTLDPATGAVRVDPTVAAGSYTMTYKVCVNGANPTLCETAEITITVGVAACYNDANTSAAGMPTNHGISLLRYNGIENSQWPKDRYSAFTVLESNTKGFVITRMATADLGNISKPEEGMMVYDTTEKCLKIYADNAWKCFNKPACP